MPRLLAITAFPILLVLTVALINSCSAEAAMQIVSYEEPGRYQLHESALSVIERLPPPVRVLAAVGDARIGKSTFLNMVYLHWDQSFSHSGAMPFEVGSTTEACTRGVWVHASRLPEGGSLVLVDVEGDNLGNDAVTEQLSALTVVMSSYILLFVRDVVNNAALEFLYHTTKLGKMFPNSDSFPHLGVAIRDALDLSTKYPDRQSEIMDYTTGATHEDGNDDIRREIAAVLFPRRIAAFEVQYQERKQLQNLQALNSGLYYDSVLQIISDLRETVPAKLTPNGMEMCGGDLVEMVRRLFTALENGDITVLETAFERLEKQMCDGHHFEWISPLLKTSEDDFINSNQRHLEEFTKLCKIDSYVERVKQEVESKKSGIMREREERERRKKAEEEKKKAEEERMKAEEAQRKAKEEQRRQEALKKEAELALIRAEEAKKKAEEQAAIDKRRAEEEQRRAAEEKRKLEERLRKEQEERKRAQEAQKKAQQQLNRSRRRRGGGGCMIM